MAAPSGTTWGSIVGGKGRIGIYTSVSSSGTTTTVSVQVWFWSKYGVSDSSNTYYFDTASSASTNRGKVSIKTTVSSGSGWSSSNQVKIGSSTFTYTRGTSNVTRYFAAKLTGIDAVGGTMYCSKSISVPAKASYKITYNANGGTGAPSAQTKWYGTNLKLSTTKPTKTGYTFQGWATSASGGVAYASGATYSANTAVTLYAVWKANTYKITYNANGGTGAPSDQTKTHGVNLTLSNVIPTRTNYNFLGWGTSELSTTVAYSAGATYSSNTNTTLYAVWELAYLAPRITNYEVERCDINGHISEEGTYALISCDWATDKDVTEIKIEYKTDSDSDWNEVFLSGTGMTGNIYEIIGGSLSTEFSYDIKITVSDSIGSSSNTKTIPSMSFVIDFLKGGKGVAFNKPASLEGIMDIGFKTRFSNGIDPIEIEAGSDLNNIILPGYYSCSNNATLGTLLNCPISNFFTLEVYKHYGLHQRLTSHYSYGVHTYIRNYDTNEWGDWQIIMNTEELSSTTDLNRITVPGIYYSQGSNPNAPSLMFESSFTLEVYQAGTVGQIVQRIIRCHKNRPTVCVRYFYQSSWGDWITVYESGINVLWEGAWFMQSGQTITLSEKISDQAEGIILIFSYYVNSTAKNEQMASFFIPKQKVALHNGKGEICNFSNHWNNVIKYLYISDTKIDGNEFNSKVVTVGGVTYTNNKYVLRYVLGV